MERSLADYSAQSHKVLDTTEHTHTHNKLILFLNINILYSSRELAISYGLTPWKKSYDQPRQHIENHRHYFANKGLSSQGYGFSYGHVWM